MEDLLRSWQRRLGLEDWKMEMETTMVSSEAWARVVYDREEKTACIYIEVDAPHPEKRIVHELLHLLLLPLCPVGTLGEVEEPIVRRIAELLTE